MSGSTLTKTISIRRAGSYTTGPCQLPLVTAHHMRKTYLAGVVGKTAQEARQWGEACLKQAIPNWQASTIVNNSQFSEFKKFWGEENVILDPLEN
jgi:hypothetical protein